MTQEGYLKGKRVTLRPKTISDASREYLWATDAELMELDASAVFDRSFEEFLGQLEEEIKKPNHRSRRFSIQTPEGDHIGNCACYNIDARTREAELGIIIGDRRYLGNGYGTDAIKVLVHYALDELGLRRIRLRTLSSNVRAQKCFSKCGFTFQDVFLHHDKEFVSMELVRNR